MLFDRKIVSLMGVCLSLNDFATSVHEMSEYLFLLHNKNYAHSHSFSEQESGLNESRQVEKYQTTMD